MLPDLQNFALYLLLRIDLPKDVLLIHVKLCIGKEKEIKSFIKSYNLWYQSSFPHLSLVLFCSTIMMYNAHITSSGHQ